MYKTLSPGAIGIHDLSLADSIALAARTGFAGLDFSIDQAAQLADEVGAAGVKALFDEAGLRFGAWGLPVRWQTDDWEADLAQLPRYAALAAELGADRTSTWCPPASDQRDFATNFAWHVARFQPIAAALAEHGIRFGIEFIGPQTLRPAHKHAFIYAMEGMLELTAALGTGNVGLLLDAWHLYTSGGAVDDLDKISNADIVNVHVNDAPLNLQMHEYIDDDRRLPLETGVLPLRDFMRKLADLEYDGPVTPEPFSARLNAMDDGQQAAQITAESMNQLWELAGLA
ncbi:MAG: sugar phosphate isomerase/epimerase [Chloroflexi bacterium]|nr:sugar phosphate isomerase/epimerase [Chloroflexota bacterium]MCY4246782.1 sugar phosphate isomerase/epimerase [Chloroflexota bacterium]